MPIFGLPRSSPIVAARKSLTGSAYVGGSLSLTSGQFLYNQTTKQKGYGGGGGLISFGATTISGTQFISNTAADWGGGAYIANFPNATPSVITNGQFLSNTAISGGGGGLFMWYTSTLTSVDFYTNTAGFRGGGAYAGSRNSSNMMLAM